MSCVRAGGGVGAIVCSLHSKYVRAFQLSGQQKRAVMPAVVGLVPSFDHLCTWKWLSRISFPFKRLADDLKQN